MHHISIDIETYSPEPIKKTGLYRYAQHPDFTILLFAYSIDGGSVKVIDLTQPGAALDYTIVQMLFDPQCEKHAFNAAFEWYCLSRRFGMTEETAAAWLPQWRDTQLSSLYCGFPAGLDAAGKALGLPENKQKLAAGKALIRYFCTPCKPTKNNGMRSRNLPKHDPDKWRLFCEYNAQDVVTEVEIARKLSAFPVPGSVQRQWEMDQRINLRGVAADMELLDGALACGAEDRQRLYEEAVRLTGVGNPNSTAQLLTWLEEETGEDIDNLRKDTVSDMLIRGLDSAAAERVLRIRRELGKTSTKKYNAIETCVCCDGRVRGLMQFYGANRTGREAGRLVQIQNLPRDTVPAEDAARALVKQRCTDGLRAVYGSVQGALSALIRTAFTAGEGKTFIDADFSAIEARVIAWLAGENWVLDVFRTHGKIYEATAAQMFSVPIEQIKKGQPEYEYRKKGKVATLALGYQGGPGALVAMGALRSGLVEKELPEIVTRWRNSNPAIVQLWYDMEMAANLAVNSGRTTRVGRVVVAREQAADLDFMTILLPSGRKLYYAFPHFGKNRFNKDSLCYMGMNQTTKKWTVCETYGGKLTENVTQAVARDCLFHAMERLEAAGYSIVFDIHDEVVIEADAQTASLEDVVQIMSVPPEWADDLPLGADGWINPYFKKD